MKIKYHSLSGIILYTFFTFCFPDLNALEVKIGTIAPENTSWGKSLKALAKDWYDISKGEILVKIYAGGIAGGEDAMIRKLQGHRSTLQGAALTSLGLNLISPEVLTLSLPLLVRNDEEFQWLINELQNTFEKRFYEKGFVLIKLIPAGWVNFFARQPVYFPEDLMRQRLGVDSKAEFLQAWRSAGFNVVPMDIIETTGALQSGKIDAFYSPPYVCAAFSWFTAAKNMCSLKIAPILGGLLISDNIWKSIPDNIKPKLMEAAQKILASLDAETKVKEQEAIKTMVDNGLTINQLNAAHEKKWNELILSGHDDAIGKVIPKDFYLLVRDKLATYRKKHDK
jgi:TRAP-type C4-dicarboxylate transport system substrate-binding protein